MPMRRKAVPVASRSSSAPRPRASGWQNRWTGQARVAGADRKVPCFQLQHHAAGGQFVFPQAADQLFVSRHRYASGSAGWVRSVLKVVSALIDLVSRDGPTERVSSPRALAASDGPSSPRWRRASLSVSAWRWPSRVMLCDASFRAWTAPIPGSRRTGSGAGRAAAYCSPITAKPRGLSRAAAIWSAVGWVRGRWRQ